MKLLSCAEDASCLLRRYVRRDTPNDAGCSTSPPFATDGPLADVWLEVPWRGITPFGDLKRYDRHAVGVRPTAMTESLKIERGIFFFTDHAWCTVWKLRTHVATLLYVAQRVTHFSAPGLSQKIGMPKELEGENNR